MWPSLKCFTNWVTMCSEHSGESSHADVKLFWPAGPWWLRGPDAGGDADSIWTQPLTGFNYLIWAVIGRTFNFFFLFYTKTDLRLWGLWVAGIWLAQKQLQTRCKFKFFSAVFPFNLTAKFCSNTKNAFLPFVCKNTVERAEVTRMMR